MRHVWSWRNDFNNRGFQRIIAAVDEHLGDLDLALVHANGRVDRLTRLAAESAPYVVLQYSMRSTKTPSTRSWLPLWRHATLVWSYYDLPGACAQDGAPADFRFHRSPLGIAAAFTSPPEAEKRYAVVTHGGYLTQSVRECVAAAARVGERAAHVGEPFPGHDNVDFFENVDDEELAEVYAASRYVCGLRRVEGFEMPAAEGLACGARPILFDREHYRHWFGDHAAYIPEDDREAVIDAVARVLASDNPVSADERRWAVETFDWKPILEGVRGAVAG